MKEILADPNLIKLKSTDLVEFTCCGCNNKSFKQKKHLVYSIKRDLPLYCSSKCKTNSISTAQPTNCKQCNKETTITWNKRRNNKSGNYFCSKSCAATYNNLHKSFGSRKSKLEIWLENKVTVKYPQLNILYCNKNTINSELDIYIPQLKLAFELNGIYHYEPIHGQDKLDKIKNNDNRKFQACLEKGIELCIIDTSTLKYFKESNCQKFLDIIKNIIDFKLLSVTD